MLLSTTSSSRILAVLVREMIAQDPAKRPSSALVTQFFRDEGFAAITHLDPRASRAIQEATEGLYVRRGGNPTQINATVYRQALRDVLGGSLPVDASGNGIKETILPPRTNVTQFQNWVERQTLTTITHSSVDRRPPRYGDLRTAVPIEHIIDEGRFVMTRPGQYMILMADNMPLKTSQGRTFIVNIDPREVVR
jgi:hypothetical protein